MTKLILWGILILLVLRAVTRLVRGVLEGAGYGPQISPPPGVDLVRDPVCGVFVVPGKALTLGTSAGTKYFCSEKCRKEWGNR